MLNNLSTKKIQNLITICCLIMLSSTSKLCYNNAIFNKDYLLDFDISEDNLIYLYQYNDLFDEGDTEDTNPAENSTNEYNNNSKTKTYKYKITEEFLNELNEEEIENLDYDNIYYSEEDKSYYYLDELNNDEIEEKQLNNDINNNNSNNNSNNYNSNEGQEEYNDQDEETVENEESFIANYYEKFLKKEEYSLSKSIQNYFRKINAKLLVHNALRESKIYYKEALFC